MGNEIREEWFDYYEMLERIRKSGIVNMYGAVPYLAKLTGIDESLASDILANWMINYDKLNRKFGWQ